MFKDLLTFFLHRVSHIANGQIFAGVFNLMHIMEDVIHRVHPAAPLLQLCLEACSLLPEVLSFISSSQTCKACVVEKV